MDEIFPKGVAWIDGQFVKLSDAKIKVTFDVSTALGAGIADTNKCYMWPEEPVVTITLTE